MAMGIIIGPIPASAVAAVEGNGSAPEPRFHLLAVGSAVAGVPTFPVPSVALFQVPKIATGSYGCPPFWRSPAVQFGSAERSVTKRTGRSGRPTVSTHAGSPV